MTGRNARHRPAQISELALIERLARHVVVRPGVRIGIGDDAAVLAGDPPIVVTQDLLVDDVQFRRTTSSLLDIGHKAIAVNLSDLAAMGAEPVAVFVGLVLPQERPLTEPDIDELYRGMESIAAEHAVTIAGGDITTGPTLTLAVTAVGRLASGVEPALRSGALPGDALCVTGPLGAAAAGLLVLDHPELAEGVGEAPALRTAARRPVPRVAAGQRLAAAGVHAMLDCSDGLALDSRRIADASGVTVAIDLADVPVAPGVAAVAANAGREADMLAATGGEDYELIVAAPAGRIAALRATAGCPLIGVGRIMAGPARLVVTRDGRPVPLATLGWEHRSGGGADAR
jgi:thiamine-monophosphate kinase